MSSAEQVIELINQSEAVPLPDNQLAMPMYCNTKISFLRQAVKLLEDEIKSLHELGKSYNYTNGMDNMNYNNLKGGKRRKTRKARKALKARK